MAVTKHLEVFRLDAICCSRTRLADIDDEISSLDQETVLVAFSHDVDQPIAAVVRQKRQGAAVVPAAEVEVEVDALVAGLAQLPAMLQRRSVERLGAGIGERSPSVEQGRFSCDGDDAGPFFGGTTWHLAVRGGRHTYRGGSQTTTRASRSVR